MDDDLAELLLRSAGGDRWAFLRFYDATRVAVYRLELMRAGEAESAEQAAAARFVEAWRRAGAHLASGLSPLAWLLSLPVAPARRAAPVRMLHGDGAACA